jgi:hypothetical protein
VSHDFPEGAEGPDATDAVTGNSAVDDVVASLDAVDEMPVSEHGEVYRVAHEKLRAALDDDTAGERAPGT